MPVCIKGQIKVTFTVPSGLGRFCRGGRWCIPGFSEDLGPVSQPTTVRHFIWTLGGTGASAGHSGFPLARGQWQGEERRAGQAGRGCSGSVWVKSRVRNQGCGRQNSDFGILERAVAEGMTGCRSMEVPWRAWEIPWLRKVLVRCMLHAVDSGGWVGDRKQPLCQLNLPLLVPESPFKGLCGHRSGSHSIFSYSVFSSVPR